MTTNTVLEINPIDKLNSSLSTDNLRTIIQGLLEMSNEQVDKVIL
jgi:hypothetical protein